jgi:hypothetical protein
MDLADLLEIEAIKRLKYRYMRCVDQKRWDELADCFTDDVTVAYDSGNHTFAGRDRVVRFLARSMPDTKLTSHRAHHPEIDLTGPDTAEATWAMDDAVMDLAKVTTIRGAGFYSDSYRKVDGAWRISRTGYLRTYMEIHQQDEAPGFRPAPPWWWTDDNVRALPAESDPGRERGRR